MKRILCTMLIFVLVFSSAVTANADIFGASTNDSALPSYQHYAGIAASETEKEGEFVYYVFEGVTPKERRNFFEYLIEYGYAQGESTTQEDMVVVWFNNGSVNIGTGYINESYALLVVYPLGSKLMGVSGAGSASGGSIFDGGSATGQVTAPDFKAYLKRTPSREYLASDGRISQIYEHVSSDDDIAECLGYVSMLTDDYGFEIMEQKIDDQRATNPYAGYSAQFTMEKDGKVVYMYIITYISTVNLRYDSDIVRVRPDGTVVN